MIPAIIGILLLIVVIFVALRVLGNVIMGAVLIGLVFFASYLILGSIPDLRDVPLIGKYLPELPSSTGEAIAIVRNVFNSVEILSVNKDLSGNLLVTVVNTGKLEASDFEVFVDGQKAQIINSPADPLESGKTTVLQVQWQGEYSNILVQTDKTSDTYP